MGHQPLRLAAAMTATGWLRRYAAHPDPATAASNLVALVVGGNGPFYPLYALALIGWHHSGAWATMLATPGFLLVPSLSRRHAAAGRVALPLIGIVNTIWCTALLGTASEVGLFVFPCIALTVLLFRDDERPRGLLLMALAIGTQIWMVEFPMKGLMDLRADQASDLARLNAISVATLIGFVALTLAGLLRQIKAEGKLPPQQQ
jgi:hypothetical protein